MGIYLTLLLVEDNEDDAFLLVRSLRQGGFEVVWERVQTPVQFQAALAAQSWDAIICDYNLPRFSAPAALEIMRSAGLDLPFIVLSGVINEKTAVEIMRAGAHDVIFKNNLARLAVVLSREINVAHSRGELKMAEAALRESEERYRGLVENSPDAVIVQVGGKFAFINSAALDLIGAVSPQDLLGETVIDHFQPKYRGMILERKALIREGKVKVPLAELVCLRLDGKEVTVEVAAAPISYRGQDGSLVFIRDISVRKVHEAEMARINRLYVVQCEINRAALHAISSVDFLDDVCRLFSSQEGILMTAVVRLIDAVEGADQPVQTTRRTAGSGVSGQLMRVVAASGELAGDLIGADLLAAPTWEVRQPCVVINPPEGPGSVFNALSLQPKLCVPWHTWLEANAWCATAIFPIRVQISQWGFLAVFTSDAEILTERDMALLEACVDDVAYGLGRSG